MQNVPQGQLALEDYSKLISLDLRGPFEGSTEARPLADSAGICQPSKGESLDEDATCPNAYGVNGGSAVGWTIDSTIVNGFWDNGIHLCHSDGAVIKNSRIQFNGRTGVAAYCPGSTNYTVTNSVIRFNGQDGIDSSGDDSHYTNNRLEYNGWAGFPGDANGIVLADGAGVEVTDNYLRGNHEYGVHFLAALTSASLTRNIAKSNSLGCWFSHPNVTFTSNSCNFIARIDGPRSVQPFNICTWSADVSGGSGGYSYEWYRNGSLVSTRPFYSASAGNSNFSLELIARDIIATEDDLMNVSVTSLAPDCGF